MQSAFFFLGCGFPRSGSKEIQRMKYQHQRLLLKAFPVTRGEVIEADATPLHSSLRWPVGRLWDSPGRKERPDRQPGVGQPHRVPFIQHFKIGT